MTNFKSILFLSFFCIGLLTSCDKEEEITLTENKISLSFDGGEPISFTSNFLLRHPTDSTYLGRLINMYAQDENTTQNEEGDVLIAFSEPTMPLPQTIGVLDFSASFYLDSSGSFFWMPNESEIQVTITEYQDQAGGFIKGTLTGVVTDYIRAEAGVSVTGEFRFPID